MLNFGLFNNPWARAVVTEPYITMDGVLTQEECLKAVTLCENDGHRWERAETFGGTDDDKRRCDIKFVFLTADNAWLFQKLNAVLVAINSAYYGFDLNGYEYFQYTSYDASYRGTYGWHMDMFMGGPERGLPPDMIQPRKLSLSLLLNEGYEGGGFQFNLGGQEHPNTVDVKMGRVIAFPSYMIHSVKPVTQGVRRSIVIWVTGPKWR